MAKLVGPFQSRRSVTLRRTAYVRTWRGIPMLVRWPRARGTPKSPAQRGAIRWFTEANALAKRAPTEQQMLARELAEGTKNLPRDFLVGAMAGNIFAIGLDGAQTLYSVSALSDVSANLDIIAQLEGEMLVRDSGLWVPLKPGASGLVLTAQGLGKKPQWKPVVSSGSPSTTTIRNSGLSTNSRAAMGFRFKTLFPTTVFSLIFEADPNGSATYHGELWKMDPDLLVSLEGSTPNANINSSVRLPVRVDFPTKVELDADTVYTAFAVRTDGGDTTSARIAGGTEIRLPGPFTNPIDGQELAKTTPEINDDPIDTSIRAVNLVYAISVPNA